MNAEVYRLIAIIKALQEKLEALEKRVDRAETRLTGLVEGDYFD